MHGAGGPKKRCRVAVKQLRKSYERPDAEVPLGRLDEPVVANVETAVFGHALLREPESFASPTNIGGNEVEVRLLGGHWHFAVGTSPSGS